jgi:Ca2+-binding EF-hand superfamily protein
MASLLCEGENGEMKSMAKIIFDKYDMAGDGWIARSEFHQLVESLGHHMDQETEEAAWTAVESDGSGKLTYKEFAAWWTTDDRWSHLQLSEEEIANLTQVHTYFKYYDEENNGELNRAEFLNVYNYMKDSGYVLEDFELVFDEIDTTKDGTINYNEFIVWMVGVGVLVNSNIKRIAVRHHRESLLSRNQPIIFQSLLCSANEIASALLDEESNDSTCCESLSAVLTFIRDGTRVKGKVIFEEDGADDFNPHVLALTIFAVQNGDGIVGGQDLFKNLASGVFIEGAGYDGSARLIIRVLDEINKEKESAPDQFQSVLTLLLNNFQ